MGVELLSDIHPLCVMLADAYTRTFARGGKLFEDNGGLPVLAAGQSAAQQAQMMQQHVHDALHCSQPWRQQQAGCTRDHRSSHVLDTLGDSTPMQQT